MNEVTLETDVCSLYLNVRDWRPVVRAPEYPLLTDNMGAAPSDFCPLQRPMKWESAATFSSPTSISLAFPVAGGRKIELAVAPYQSVDGGGDFFSVLGPSSPLEIVLSLWH
ncbi:hypothetical protein POTOM_049928 [Populus tomentosa]|uniref:Uncharacterized protein n=1 Tax=Populus tomentosa TaxID=118781 RepID=A0A8X7Y777_POPTO|nr:hypothetical protein POTOM_049928 [Populus tomentosa]